MAFLFSFNVWFSGRYGFRYVYRAGRETWSRMFASAKTPSGESLHLKAEVEKLLDRVRWGAIDGGLLDRRPFCRQLAGEGLVRHCEARSDTIRG
jgi:hypothetical protein